MGSKRKKSKAALARSSIRIPIRSTYDCLGLSGLLTATRHSSSTGSEQPDSSISASDEVLHLFLSRSPRSFRQLTLR